MIRNAKAGVVNLPNSKFGTEALDSVSTLVNLGSRTTRGFIPKRKWLFANLDPDESQVSFGLLSIGRNKTRVYKGYIRSPEIGDQGLQNVLIAQADKTLTGSTCWIYVYREWANPTTGGIDLDASMPKSDSTYFRWPLALYTAVSAGIYSLTLRTWRGGDIFCPALR